MKRLAFGRMRMDPKVFWRMTVMEFEDAVDGWLDQQEEDRHWAAERELCVIEACAMNKVDLREMRRRMKGEEPEVNLDEGEFAFMIAESREQVRRKKRPANGNGAAHA
jgi:hypothetical protein